VPEVVDELTTSRVLTMEFVDDMVHCNDADKLRAAGFDPMEVAGLLSDTFAEMLFCTGFVHGDPHGGNVYCRRGAGGATEIVVLDHGLYHRIDDALRRELCEYVVACAMRDGPTMERLGLRFAGPLHRYFPLLLSPWFIFGARLSADEVQAAREKRMPPGVDLKELGQFLVNMHDQAGENNILGVLHSMGYTRGMLQDVGFPEKLRLQSYVRFASLGLNQQAPGQYDDSLSARAHQRWCLLQVEALSLLVALLGGGGSARTEPGRLRPASSGGRTAPLPPGPAALGVAGEHPRPRHGPGILSALGGEPTRRVSTAGAVRAPRSRWKGGAPSSGLRLIHYGV
jgi:hypothetical protein